MADKIRINSKFDVQGNYEPSDSENEYSTSEKKLLDKLRKRKHDDSGSEEELYGFSESEEEEENDKNDLNMADSDVEGQENSDDDLPDSKAWGKKKKSYYSTDYVDEDYGGFGDDEEDALMEEQEAKNIQKRLIEQLADEDFSLEFFSPPIKETEVREEVIKSDLSHMSKRQKLQIFEKESPEFAGLVDDFKNKLTVAKDDLHPVLQLVKGGKLPKCPASKFVKTNYNLILNYCTNISFYLLLKSQRINIQNHPVIKRLYQYRQMLNKMEPIYLEVIKPQIDKILEAVNNSIELTVIGDKKKEAKKRKTDKLSLEHVPKKLKIINELEKDEGEDTGVSDDDEEDVIGDELLRPQASDVQKSTESEESGFSDNDELDNEDNKPSVSSQGLTTDDIAEKREITYQIAKNKGLTPHRKKEQRNPRVKHKLKYRKAKIRRKGAIREPRSEVARYSGEVSGIKANVKKSIKIK
ncbi:PREDICTED: something about silencing protein 10 [Papilio polytes]|uniref:something about silencing protein 10 n=1 Tax=Papilio polytes TaxID=76194 RepID=UPI00067677C8|nr:PREDICTED: something about silencing protein 10 [Papilio polytes]